MNHHTHLADGLDRIAAIVAVGGATSVGVSGVLDRIATVVLSILASLIVGVVLELLRPRLRRWSGEAAAPAPARTQESADPPEVDAP